MFTNSKLNLFFTALFVILKNSRIDKFPITIKVKSKKKL